MGLDFPEAYGGIPCDKFMHVAYTEEICRAAPSASCRVWEAMRSPAPRSCTWNGRAEAAFPDPGLPGTEDRRPGDHGTRCRLRCGEHPHPGRPGRGPLRRQRRQDLHHQRLPGEFHHHGGADRWSGFKGISLLVIDSSTPGFSVAKKIRKMGWNASDTAELSFEDCRVPAENLLGGEGMGFYGIMANFQNERLALAVMAHATAELALEESIKYAKTREAFGKTLSGFQVTATSSWTWPQRSPWPRNTTTASRRRCRRESTASGGLHGKELRL